MSDLPKTMKAIKVVEPGKPEIQEVPLPKMRDDYILVKVKAVALNPYDIPKQLITRKDEPC
jgi:NADPH:quinone reductase-like Zn-dependent oxidoreductase